MKGTVSRQTLLSFPVLLTELLLPDAPEVPVVTLLSLSLPPRTESGPRRPTHSRYDRTSVPSELVVVRTSRQTGRLPVDVSHPLTPSSRHWSGNERVHVCGRWVFPLSRVSGHTVGPFTGQTSGPTSDPVRVSP